MNAIASFTIKDLKLEIVPTELSQAEVLYNLVDSNRKILSTWFSWVDGMRSVADEQNFITYAQSRARERGLFLFTILADDKVIGMIDLHNVKDQQAEFGYWLDERYQGRGIASAAVRQVGQYAS